MKFNITRDDAEFHINKEKGIVVCNICGTRDLFKRFAQENFRIGYECDEEYNFIHYINKGNSLLAEKLKMPEKFTGVARLGTDDEWDEEIGCAIAFSRAKDALVKSFWKRVETYTYTLQGWLYESIDMMNRLGEKFSVNMEKRHNYIESLFQRANNANKKYNLFIR